MHIPQYQSHSGDGWEDAFNIDRRFPRRWYERAWLHAGVGILAGTLLGAVIWQLGGFPPPLWLSITAIIFYLCSFLFDIAATHRHVRLKSQFDDLGLAMPTCEANPLLPAYPTLAQQIFNIATLLSLLYVPLIFLLPGAGFGGAILHGLAGMANCQAFERAGFILKGYDDQAQGYWRSWQVGRIKG